MTNNLELITLSDHALISKEGKLSIIGVFDRIFVKRLPTQYPRFFIVIILKGEATTQQTLQLELVSPTQKPVLQQKQIKITFGANNRANIITDITNLTVTEVGEHKFILRSDGNVIGQTSLFISLLNTSQHNQLPN